MILPEAAAWRGELDASGFTCERSDEWWCIQRDAHVEARLATAARPTVEQETIAMAKRFGGSKTAGFCYYHKTL